MNPSLKTSLAVSAAALFLAACSKSGDDAKAKPLPGKTLPPQTDPGEVVGVDAAGPAIESARDMASEAGLLPGDELLAIDGHRVTLGAALEVDRRDEHVRA